MEKISGTPDWSLTFPRGLIFLPQCGVLATDIEVNIKPGGGLQLAHRARDGTPKPKVRFTCPCQEKTVRSLQTEASWGAGWTTHSVCVWALLILLLLTTAYTSMGINFSTRVHVCMMFVY